MSNKKNSKGTLATLLRWIVVAVLALLSIKMIVAVAGMISVATALVTIALWGLGAVLVSGITLFLGFKLLSSKKK